MSARNLVLALSTSALVGCYDGSGGLVTADTAAQTTTLGAGELTGTGPGSSSGDASVTGVAPEGTSSTGAIAGTSTGSPTDTGLAEPTSSGGTTDATTGDPNADCPRLRVLVAPEPTLNVRPTPSTAEAPIDSLPHGAIVEVVMPVQGESIEGNTLWYQIVEPAGFVSGAFVECTFDLPPPPPAGYNLPLECGKSAKVTQGNNGNTSHMGITQYAFDFGLALNTPLVAMADGVVLHIYDETGPGDPCYDGGGPDCFPYGNLVVLLHGDGSTTLYKHLNHVEVDLDQPVLRGETVGLSGSTGYSTGPHAHVMRMENCGKNNCQSIPLSFIECGVPVQGQTVMSENCP